MRIKINGNYTETKSGINILELLEELNINPKKVVVEVNLNIIPRENYENRIVVDGDMIEIVQFVGGG